MNYLKTGVLLIFILSTGINAGPATNLGKNSKGVKNLNLSVTGTKNSAGKISVTVKVKAQEGRYKIGNIYLFRQSKNIALTPVIKGDTAIIKFDIDQKIALKSWLSFSYPDKSMCPSAYNLKYMEFIKK